MSIAAATVIDIEILPIDIDARPCEFCGLTIDQHRRVDTFEGPEFFCEELEVQIYLDAAAMRARWEAEGAPPLAQPTPAKKSYSTPQATVDAFFYVVRLDDAEYLSRWITEHPLDASALYKLWEGKNARS
jgi:hypothetical protein